MMYDVIILGSGPAGISAALYASRQKLKYIVLTKDIGGLANFIPSIKTYLGINYISGYDLVKKFVEHTKKYKVPIHEDEEILEIKNLDGSFEIRTSKSRYKSRTVIVATGRKFKRLGLASEKKFENKGVSFCAVCDGPVFRNKTIAILGGGHSGLFSALFMVEIAKKLILIDKNKIKEEGVLREVSRSVKKNKKVKIIENAQVIEFIGNKKLESIKLKQNGKIKKIKVDGCFVEIGYEPNTRFLEELVELNNRGEVIIDKNNMSDMPGIFAAGDVTDLHEKQVLVAVGEGAKAMLSVINYIEKTKKG